LRLPNRLPAEQVGLRSQRTYHEALCVVVPDPRRIVVVAVDVGEARRSESEKGLDEALRARPGPPKVSMAMGRRAVAGVAAHAGRYLACFLSLARRAGLLKPLGAPPALASRRRRSPSAQRVPCSGSENVMSGTRRGGKWRNMPLSSSEYSHRAPLAEQLPLAGWPGEPALSPYPKRTGG